MDEENRVLVACPIWAGDRGYLEQLVEQYGNYDIFLVDNTVGSSIFYKYLLGRGFEVNRVEWNPKEEYLLNVLADCDNLIRDKVLAEGYTHWLWTAPDILSPKNAIQKLLGHKKDIVGYPTNTYDLNGPPCVLKSGFMKYANGGFRLQVYGWDELNAVNGNKLLKVYALGGCTLYSKSVLEKCQFHSSDNIIWGEDCWYWSICNDAGFEFWCDTSERAYNMMSPPAMQAKVASYARKYKEKWDRENPNNIFNILFLRG